MTDAKVDTLTAIRVRNAAASTDWSIRETGAGRALYARIIPVEDPAIVTTFDRLAADADMNHLLFAQEDVKFLLELLDEAFTVIRNLRRALDRQPKPKDFAAECAMKCDDHLFQTWLHEVHGLDHPWDSNRAATKLRFLLNIKSRTELNTDQAAAERWRALRDEFDKWRRAR